jgi:hypothetical protein
VVHLGEDGEPVIGEALDDVALPERPATVEGAAHDARHQLADLLIAPRRGHGGVAHVEVDVEARVVDPVRVVEVEGDVPQPPPERFEVVQPPFDLVPPGGQRLVVRVVGPLVDRQAGHVPELRGRLHVQEGRVQPGELLHGSPPSPHVDWYRAISARPTTM